MTTNLKYWLYLYAKISQFVCLVHVSATESYSIIAINSFILKNLGGVWCTPNKKMWRET